MILIRLSYGLGNQMFQYAFGRRIAIEKAMPVKFDLHWYHKARADEFRPMQLPVFNCKMDFCSMEERDYFYNLTLPKRIINKINRNIAPYFKQDIIIEHLRYQFDEKVYRNIKNPAYYSGFWQHEGYFNSINAVLREEFNLKESLDPLNYETLQKIQYHYDQSVCLHIRRGDYIGNEIFDLNGPEYYKRAISVIKSRIEAPVFFVFSNDPAWVKQNFRGKEYCIVDHNDESNSYKDLQLMKSCKHFIISNSSFSWWAAWLSKDKNQVKIAPSRWVNFPDVKKTDIIPKDWLII